MASDNLPEIATNPPPLMGVNFIACDASAHFSRLGTAANYNRRLVDESKIAVQAVNAVRPAANAGPLRSFRVVDRRLDQPRRRRRLFTDPYRSRRIAPIFIFQDFWQPLSTENPSQSSQYPPKVADLLGRRLPAVPID